LSVEVIQGDCLEVLARAEHRGRYDLVLADPPFNLGKEFGAGVDDARPQADYRAWLAAFYAVCYAAGAHDAVLYAHCDPDGLPVHRALIGEAGWQYCQTLVWWGRNGMKRRGPLGGRIWATLYEFIVYARKGDGLPRQDIMPWYHGVIEVPRPQSNHPQGRWHVCEKPVRLYKLLLQAHQGVKLVLDPTCGSGSSLVACAELGLDAVGIELVPASADLARDRVRAAQRAIPYAQQRLGLQPLLRRP